MRRTTFIPLLVAVAFVVGCIQAKHPEALANGGRQGLGLLMFILVTMAVYVVIVWLHPKTESPKIATVFGIAIGGCWVMEIVAGNCGMKLGLLGTALFYRAPVVLVVILNVTIGAVASVRGRSLSAAVRAGAVSGMIGGLIAMLALACVIMFSMGIQMADLQNIREFERSHSHDLAVYIVQEYLFAGANHLWIGLLSGLILGGGGGAIGKIAKSGRQLTIP